MAVGAGFKKSSFLKPENVEEALRWRLLHGPEIWLVLNTDVLKDNTKVKHIQDSGQINTCIQNLASDADSSNMEGLPLHTMCSPDIFNS